ncbi:MAG: ComF family protein [Rhizomicrobium sp.]
MAMMFESAPDLQSHARRAGRMMLDFLYPPLCATCRAPVSEPHALCSECWKAIAFLEGPMCVICGLPFELDPGSDTVCGACHAHPPPFDSARSVMRYDDASRKSILALKRADRLDLALPFARWLERAGKPIIAQADAILPVPLHWRRLWTRRYNQSAVLARLISRHSGKPLDLLSLRRVRPTPSQGEMVSAKARRRNVRGAFNVDPARQPFVAEKTVLLIDDVLTTGATVAACARALKRAGAARVLVLTLARVVRPLPGDI